MKSSAEVMFIRRVWYRSWALLLCSWVMYLGCTFLARSRVKPLHMSPCTKTFIVIMPAFPVSRHTAKNCEVLQG